MFTYGGDHFQPCTNSPFRVVFMRLGIAEVNYHPIAGVRGHEAAEALNSLCDALVVDRDDFAVVLRIHVG